MNELLWPSEQVSQPEQKKENKIKFLVVLKILRTIRWAGHGARVRVGRFHPFIGHKGP